MAGTCIEADVFCYCATNVSFQKSSLEGIALDCGADVLFLIGAWWLNKNRLDVFENNKYRHRFPARRFCIRFLPISGRVLFVEILDEILRVNEPKPLEPIVDLVFSKYAEVVLVNQTLQSMIVNLEK